MSQRRPDLDDPEYAAFAWRRYRRILGWMTLFAVVAAAISVVAIWLSLGGLPLHAVIATSLGVFFTVWLAAALMGLMFLSSGSGHDERIEDPLADEIDIGD
jgi:membrane glycosyltransferase